MSDAADRLARSRLAIIERIQNGESRPQRSEPERERRAGAEEARQPEPSWRAGWFARFRHAAATWWRHHPAHLGLELATPALSAYAQRKPLQYLGIAAAVGAVLVIARPWRLISVTSLLVAIAKSSQLSSVVLSALSAADFQRDQDRHE